MFSLFKGKKISISSVSITDFGWTKTKENNSIIQWINPEQSIAVSINFFEMPPDIPTMTNIDILRKFYRNSISQINGGLIEVQLSKKNKIPFIKTIFKLPQEQSGMTYIASLTIPFMTCSFVLKVQAAEISATGIREAVIADRLMSSNTLSLNESEHSDWMVDPYDNNFKGGTLMNKSERENYDFEFPNHPLTQARQLITQIENDFQWKPELETLAAFNK